MTPVFRVYDALLELLCGLAMAGTVVIMSAQVILRFVFNSPLTWAEEVSTYLFIWVVYLGSGLAFVRKAHVGVDYLLGIFSERVLRVLSVVLSSLLVAFLAFLAYWGWEFTRLNWGVPLYTTSALTLGMAYLAFPLGTVTMIVGVLRSFTMLWNVRKYEEEAAAATLVAEI